MFLRTFCVAVTVSLLGFAVGSVQVRGEDEVSSPINRYKVPEGDVAAVFKFLTKLEAYTPEGAEERLAYQENARKAFQTAAERILKLEKDKTSVAYRKASAISLQLRLSEVRGGTRQSQLGFYRDILAHLKSAKSVSQQDLGLAFTFGQLIEQSGNVELTKKAFGEFGKIFLASEDEQLAVYGEKMVGVARRLDLPGKKMKLEGTTLDGESLDWEAYRGKVVLVDFWATWCGPCVQELPNVKENYTKYHDKGFEVVGISLDSNVDRLRRFITDSEIPWVCLFEEGAATNHPMANYYGVMSIPTTMLLDRDGKVAAMNVRGGELGRELEKLLASSRTEETSQ